MPDQPSVSIAYFVTSHGFGHASRAAAVMAALQARMPGIRFEVFTTSPAWIFQDTLQSPFGYHPITVDIGMVQLSPLRTDLHATCEALDRLLPFGAALLDRLARLLKTTGCAIVVCDIAALGIAAAQKAGLPSVLVENFTWDWIYQGYEDQAPRLRRHIAYLDEFYGRADLRLQTEPLCLARADCPKLGPICRMPRSKPVAVHKDLELPPRPKIILVSMGGVPDEFAFLEHVPPTPGMVLVVAGAREFRRVRENVVLLPTHSRFYHPDLILAADALIGKAGYSTVAEAYHAGVPFGYVSRADSPESPILEAFIAANLPSRAISAQDYASGGWIRTLPHLLAMPRTCHHHANGAGYAAESIITLLAR